VKLYNLYKINALHRK